MSSNKNTNKRIKIAENLSTFTADNQSTPTADNQSTPTADNQSTPIGQQQQSNIFISGGFEETKGEESVSDVSVSPFGLGIMTHGTPMPSNDLSLISSDVPVDMGLFTNIIKSNKKMKIIIETSPTKVSKPDAKPDVVLVYVYGNYISGLETHPHYNPFVANAVAIVGFYHGRRFLKGEIEKNGRKCPLKFQCRYPAYMHKVLDGMAVNVIIFIQIYDIFFGYFVDYANTNDEEGKPVINKGDVLSIMDIDRGVIWLSTAAPSDNPTVFLHASNKIHSFVELLTNAYHGQQSGDTDRVFSIQKHQVEINESLKQYLWYIYA